MKLYSLALCTLSFSACCSLPALADTVLYSQSSNVGGSWASQNAASVGGNFATAYDDFKLSSASTITSIQWTGSFFNSAPAAISSFAISFYSNAGGQPGSLLSTSTVAGNGGQTATAAAGNPYGTEYTYTDVVAFTAAANTEYWVSIIPTLNYPPQWGWDTSSQGDSVMYQDFQGTRYDHAGYDQAFTLTGNIAAVTPEPSSLILAGTGLLGVMGAFRQRRRKV